MSYKKNITAKVFTWESSKLVAPGGDLNRLFRASPSEIWAMFQLVNPPNNLVKQKIRSCLTEVYLSYLSQAHALFLLGPNERNERKRNWKDSVDWPQLERLAVGQQLPKAISTREVIAHRDPRFGRLGSITDNCKPQPVSQALVKQEHQVPEPTASEGKSVTGLPPAQDLSILLQSLTTAVKAQQGVMCNSIGQGNHGGGMKRGFDFEADDGFDLNKRTKITFDAQVYYGKYPSGLPPVSSTGSNPESPPTNSLPGMVSDESTNSSVLDTGDQAKGYGVAPLEDSASIWLNYHLRSVLEAHPPTVPKEPNTGHAIECARPYLLSLQTRLTCLAAITEDAYLKAELEAAARDLATAWGCLSVVKTDKVVEDENGKENETHFSGTHNERRLMIGGHNCNGNGDGGWKHWTAIL